MYVVAFAMEWLRGLLKLPISSMLDRQTCYLFQSSFTINKAIPLDTSVSGGPTLLCWRKMSLRLPLGMSSRCST